VHLPLSEGTDTVPAQMQDMVADLTGGNALHPIARLDTSRTVRRLTGADGQVLAEVADDEVTARRLHPDGSPMRWHEIEVELVSGPPMVLEAAGKLLREAGARPSASASKLGRLLAAG
jgi:inorganic triphosphatase YgiF